MDYASQQATAPGTTSPSLASAISRLDQVISYLSGHSEQSGAYADILGGRPGTNQGVPERASPDKQDSAVGTFHARIDRIVDLLDKTSSNLNRIGTAMGASTHG